MTFADLTLPTPPPSGKDFCAIPAPVRYIPGEDPVIRARKLHKREAALAGGDLTQGFNLYKDQLLGSLPDLNCELKPSWFMTTWIMWAYAGVSDRFRNILKVGEAKKDYPKSPGIYQHASTMEKPSTQMRFVMSTDQNPDWGCDPTFQPNPGTWLYVSMAIYKADKNKKGYNQKLQVYYNTDLACEATTNATVLVPEKQVLMGADSGHEPSEAQLYQLIFYPNWVDTPPGDNYTSILRDLIKQSPPKGARDGTLTRKYIRKENYFGPVPSNTSLRPRMENIDYPMDHLVTARERTRLHSRFRKYQSPHQVSNGQIERIKPGPAPGAGAKAPPKTEVVKETLMDSNDVTTLTTDDALLEAQEGESKESLDGDQDADQDGDQDGDQDADQDGDLTVTAEEVSP